MTSNMVTVFDIDNSNNILYIHRSNNETVLQPNTIPMGPFDTFLPKYFKITLYEDWDKYDDYIVTKITSDNFSLAMVIVDKYLLYSIIKEKESFLLVGEKVFYLENPDLMLYRTDNYISSYGSDDDLSI